MQTVTQKWAERLALAAIGTFFGLFLASAFKIGWQTVEWETLIAGSLAVSAALLTVNQMQKGELEQNKRHTALMRLSIRSDILKVRRAARPYAGYLTLFSGDIQKEIVPTNTGFDARNFESLLEPAKSIVFTLKKPEILAVVEYLGADETLRFELLCRSADTFTGADQQRVQMLVRNPLAAETILQRQHVIIAAMLLAAQTQQFANDLQVLDELYSQGRIFDHVV